MEPEKWREIENLVQQYNSELVRKIAEVLIPESRFPNPEPDCALGLPYTCDRTWNDQAVNDQAVGTNDLIEASPSHHHDIRTDSIKGIQEFVNEHQHPNMVSQIQRKFSFTRFCPYPKEPVRTGFLADFISSKRFDVLTTTVILLNTAYTIYDTNWQMANLTASTTSSIMIELGFTCFYAVELALKLVVHRVYFFWNDDSRWNVFDLILVLVGLADAILASMLQATFLNPSFMRLIRILKILKKVSRVVKVVRFFSDLRLMLQCIVGSVVSLFWSVVLLIGFLVLFSIIFVQQLSSVLVDDAITVSDDQRIAIKLAFGSVQQGTLTLFACISGGTDWIVIYDMIVFSGEFGGLVFIFYVLLMWLSMTNIVTSIFVDKAMQLAQPDVNQQLLEKRREDLGVAIDLRALFTEMDTDGAGTLSVEKLERCLQEDMRVTTYFELQGLDIKNAHVFLDLLKECSKTGTVDLDTFISGCLSMKGPATNIDLLTILHEIRALVHPNLETIHHKLTQSLCEQACGQRHILNSIRGSGMEAPLCAAKTKPKNSLKQLVDHLEGQSF